MKEKKYLFDDQKNVTWLIRFLWIACGILFLLDFAVNRKIYHPLENIPGFYPIYGFIGCVILVVIAKWMRNYIMRDEDYYSDKQQEQQPVTKKDGDNHVAS